MDLDLKDRVALVTASSRGLGFAVAKALAAEGARVVISSRSQERAQKAQARAEVEQRVSLGWLRQGPVFQAMVEARMREIVAARLRS